MSAAFAWRKIVRVGSFSRAGLAPKRAARVSVGVVLPLLAGWLSGHVEYGVYMALGALPAGFASFQGETRTRVVAVAVASVGMALSTFVGATAAAVAPWSIVPIVAVWGYLIGLSICLGDRWSVAALQWAVALAIAVGFPAGPSEAALRAGLVLAGGLLQAVLVAALWTLRPGGTERSALAASYRGLAAYASRLSEGVFESPPAAAFPAAGALDDPNPLLQHGLRLLLIDLLEQAERIRATLAALGAQALHQTTDVGDLRTLMAQTAAALELVADAVGGKPAQRPAALRALDAQIADLAIPEGAIWRWSGEALLGQLRAVARMVDAAPAPRSDPDTVANAAPARRPDELAWALDTLRANLSTRTEAGRHALRLAVVAALTEALVHATGLYQGRWATLTIFLVLKPDYASTFSRGVERALGTALGAAAGAAAVELTRHIQGEMVA
ncbi:MAG TPA: FUSC family protein, partial [Burkholderiales bacterium]|nr:FUSC family protein [Burkholderiales bacterium]